MKTGKVDDEDFYDQLHRMGSLFHGMISIPFIAALLGIKASDPGLIKARVLGSERKKRNRKYYAIMREFLVRYFQFIQILLDDVTTVEKETFGFNLPIDEDYSEEIKAFFDLLVSNRKERQDLMSKLKESGKFPRFLWADRVASELFGPRWIRNPGLTLVLQEIEREKEALSSLRNPAHLPARKKSD